MWAPGHVGKEEGGRDTSQRSFELLKLKRLKLVPKLLVSLLRLSSSLHAREHVAVEIIQANGIDAETLIHSYSGSIGLNRGGC